MKGFATAWGTTPGKKHRGPVLTRNQDSHAVHGTESLLTLTVSDGVSEAPLSHLGSGLLAEWATELMHAFADTDLTDPRIWEAIANQLADRIRTVAGWSYKSLKEAVLETWVATIGSIAIGPEYTILAAFGNPRFYVNGELIAFDDANIEKHQPACVAYLVVESTLPDTELCFKLVVYRTEDLEHALVASDGLDDVIEAEGTRIACGRGARVQPISYFWENDEFFVDPGALTGYLDRMGRDMVSPGDILLGGKLSDDVTICVARRTPISEE